jgi:hypothetical protein
MSNQEMMDILAEVSEELESIKTVAANELQG